jgi:hypothetical protein
MEVNMKKHFLTGAAVMALLLITAFTGCENPAGDGGAQTGETLRYTTVPLVARDGKSYTQVASGYDENYYYIYLLGHVSQVPVVYGAAFEYDGTTPISTSY